MYMKYTILGGSGGMLPQKKSWRVATPSSLAAETRVWYYPPDLAIYGEQVSRKLCTCIR